MIVPMIVFMLVFSLIIVAKSVNVGGVSIMSFTPIVTVTGKLSPAVFVAVTLTL